MQGSALPVPGAAAPAPPLSCRGFYVWLFLRGWLCIPPVLQEYHAVRVPPPALELSGRLGSPPGWAVLFPHTGAVARAAAGSWVSNESPTALGGLLWRGFV